MKVLNVRFSDHQKLKLKELSETLNIRESDIARAALFVGLNEIMSMTSKNVDRGIEFTAINAVKAK